MSTQTLGTLLDKVHKFKESEGLPEALIFDLDSTHSDTYGNQEDVSYNSHYGTVSYHPLVAFDEVTSDFLKSASSTHLLPPNIPTKRDIFLR